MIKLNDIGRTVRETVAPFEYTDPKTGKIVTEDIRVRYYSFTVAELKQMRAEAFAQQKAIREGDEGKVQWLSGVLVGKLAELPDILDAKNKPIAITEANLDKISVVNLTAISHAIDRDLDPKRTAAQSNAG